MRWFSCKGGITTIATHGTFEQRAENYRSMNWILKFLAPYLIVKLDALLTKGGN
jgi:hypothetical protein